MQLIDCEDALCERVIGCAISVHRELGPGLLESVYQKALAMELEMQGIKADCEVEIPVLYHGKNLGIGFRADIIVENRLLLELKSVKELNDLHLAQTITYLKLLRLKRGYLINFNVPLLKNGIRRVSI